MAEKYKKWESSMKKADGLMEQKGVSAARIAIIDEINAGAAKL